MQRLVVFSGAGISAESGLNTFRDADGLWEKYEISEVATPDAWLRNQELVLDFYSQRRKQGIEAQPNLAHKIIADLEQHFDVHVVTQNIDDLHERAGSTKVLHLHGEINKARSTADPSVVVPIDGWELKVGDQCPIGSQLRPHIVWFGEEVPLLADAIQLMRNAEIVIVVGSSLTVYPAAGLVHDAPVHATKFLVDPKAVDTHGIQNLTVIRERATTGIPKVSDFLLGKGSLRLSAL